MSEQEVFDKVSNGTMSFEEFSEWCSDQRHESYVDGANTQSYENAVSSD